MLFSVEDQLLEGYMVAVLLFLVAGVNCVIINQWYCTIDEGMAKMEQVMQGKYMHLVAENNKVLSKAVYYYLT